MVFNGFAGPGTTMTLRLSIENMDRLPDGGPLRVEVKGRGLDIGRDAHLDWTLPDPSRYVSSKHCEIRFRDGGYWLHDVSTNGTFVNGAQFRLDAPHLLRNGDRLNIGPYVIAVAIEGQGRRPSLPRRRRRRGGGARGCLGRGRRGGGARGSRRLSRAKAAGAGRRLSRFRLLRGPAGSAADAFATPAAADDIGCARRRRRSPRRRPRPPRPRRAGRRREPPPPMRRRRRAPPPASELIARIAAAAGIPERAIAGRDPNALADEIGLALRLTAQNLAQLLSSRAESKTLMRSSSRTMIRALENNPLKFTGSPDEALAIMFGPPTRNYLDARATIESSFSDLKTHQILTFGAMQGALDALFEDLAPEKIDRSVEPDQGLGALVGSRKAKLWDIYVERWRAKTKRADGRLLEAFMALFAEAYDRLQNRTS